MIKKCSILFLIIIFVILTGCSENKYDALPQIVINDIRYCSSFSLNYVDAPEQSAICGIIKSCVSDGEIPTEHEQSNFITCYNQPYAIVGNNLIVRIVYEINDKDVIEKWILLTPSS
ncbi:MAG: hypothetical protein J6C34_05035 [Oscillospiraceae bacterium]|nr:hypothetical protein [Oscillospiraceae bacterium]